VDDEPIRDQLAEYLSSRTTLDRLVERIVALAQDEPGLRYVVDQLARRLAQGRERSRASRA
jgi:hypothetical protein